MKKEHRTNRRYSAEFKIRVILDMRTNYLGYHETVYIRREYLTTVTTSLQKFDGLLCLRLHFFNRKISRHLKIYHRKMCVYNKLFGAKFSKYYKTFPCFFANSCYICIETAKGFIMKRKALQQLIEWKISCINPLMQ